MVENCDIIDSKTWDGWYFSHIIFWIVAYDPNNLSSCSPPPPSVTVYSILLLDTDKASSVFLFRARLQYSSTSIVVRKASNPRHEQLQSEQEERPTGPVLHRFDLLNCTAYSDWGRGSRELHRRKHRGWLHISQSKWCTYIYARADRL